MEMCELGDLGDHFKKSLPSLNQKVDLMEQICNGLHHLHSQTPPIVHRDLKPQNLLVASEAGLPVVKLADFGLARFVDQTMLESLCGTPMYMAPEILPNRVFVFDEVSYTKEVDVFSLGLIFQAMLRYRKGDWGLRPVLG